MSERIHIRVARIIDADVINSVDERALSDEQRRRDIWEALRHANVWIAERDETAVGFAVATLHFFGFTFIEQLRVRRDHRRHGVAQALVAAVEAWSPTEKIFTSTNESNAPMRALLDRLGYIYSGTVDNLDEGDPERFYFKQLR